MPWVRKRPDSTELGQAPLCQRQSAWTWLCSESTVFKDALGTCHIPWSASSVQGSRWAHSSVSALETGYGTEDQLFWSSEHMVKARHNSDFVILRVEAIDGLDQPRDLP